MTPSDDDLASEVGQRIQALRSEHETSRAALARICGRDAKTVWRWEHGRALPTGTDLIAISRAFEVTADWLLLGKEAKSRKTGEAAA